MTHLQQTPTIRSAPRTDDLQTRNTSVPSGVILTVLSTDTGGGAVRTTEDDGTRDVSSRHVVGLSSRVDDLVDSLHGKVPGHYDMWNWVTLSLRIVTFVMSQ
jgi:hypothetical protein